MNVNDLKKKSNRRVDTGYLRNLGIQSYGDDNLYPQHLRNIIAASSTGSECAERYANFIEGNGFREVAFSEYVVNRRGDTADDIHALVCRDVADYDGIAIHVNYNMFADIVEIQHVPFENCRLLEEDETGYIAKIAVHPDWTGKKTRKGKAIKVVQENVEFIDVLILVKKWCMHRFVLQEELKTIKDRYYGLVTQENLCILSEGLTG